MVTACKFCKRLLKSEESIEREAGLICAKKHGLIKLKVKPKCKNLFEKWKY